MSAIGKNFVAVTGIGIITNSIQSYSEMTKTQLSIWNKDRSQVSAFQLPEGQNSRELRRLSKLARMAASAADQSIRMSGAPTDSMGIGVALTHGSTSYLAEFHDLLLSYGPDNASPSAFSNGVTNAPLSTISTMNKLTSGGVTFTGFETAAIDMLNYGSEAIITNEYQSFLAGAAEEYSPIVEGVYSRLGWYNGSLPEYLPCKENTIFGYGMSEGSGFILMEPVSEQSLKKAVALYSPFVSDDEPVDLIISGAGSGPQDVYEITVLKTILKKQSANVAFTNSSFGNCFALSGLVSGISACASINKNYSILPDVEINPEIAKMVKKNETISKVMVVGASRDGQVSRSLFCSVSAVG